MAHDDPWRDPETTDPEDVRPFRELRETGLLWLINTSVLHPRGYALAFHYPDDDTDQEPIGWTIQGDGTEAWRFDGPRIDELFAKIRELLP